MKNGRFETQAEIYQALLDGKKITRATFDRDQYVELVDGYQKGTAAPWRFIDPTNWILYEEPKPKRKLYRRKWVTHGGFDGRSYACMWHVSKEMFNKAYYWVDDKSEEWEEMEVED
jgi:hypothetical protein